MTHRRLRVELGINLDAKTMTKTDPDKRLFPLQDALVDITEEWPKPFWYSHLRPHDRVSFRLVDITDLSRPRPRAQPCCPTSVHLAFSDPTSGDSCNPFEQKIQGWKVDSTSTRRLSPVYSMATGDKLPTWDLLWQGEDGWQSGPVTLAALGQVRYRCFEMSMALAVQRDSIDCFVFDPEMIVSESDNDPP